MKHSVIYVMLSGLNQMGIQGIDPDSEPDPHIWQKSLIL